MLMLCGRLLRLAAGAVKSAEATRRLTLMAVIAAVSHPSPLSSSRQRSTWNACSRRTIMRSSLVIANLHKYSSKTERNKPTLADPCPGYVGASDCPRGSMEAALARRCTLSCFCLAHRNSPSSRLPSQSSRRHDRPCTLAVESAQSAPKHCKQHPNTHSKAQCRDWPS